MKWEEKTKYRGKKIEVFYKYYNFVDLCISSFLLRKKQQDPDVYTVSHPLELCTFLVIDGIEPSIILAKSS